jgi:hypothetical protein
MHQVRKLSNPKPTGLMDDLLLDLRDRTECEEKEQALASGRLCKSDPAQTEHRRNMPHHPGAHNAPASREVATAFTTRALQYERSRARSRP